MYTRNAGSSRPQEQKSGAYGETAFGGRHPDGGMPLLIPQDYRGELLREHHSVGVQPPQTDTAEEPVPADISPTEETFPTASGETVVPERPVQVQTGGGTLLGGLYDLFIGENSSEEETVLLLAIGLLILWGHLDRGGLFDRSSWDDDGLALFLIGYLLLS